MEEGLDLWEAIFPLLSTNVPQISRTKASNFLRHNKSPMATYQITQII
jgi:hypothetical protein